MMKEKTDVERLIEENKQILGDPRLATLLENPAFWRNLVWKSLPQGHNSGLDADTVDGFHASDLIARIVKRSFGRGPDLGAGSGATKFTDLTDVPNSYTGNGLKVVQVKSTVDGLEFVTLPGETDPVVKAINGIVKSNGTTISAALSGTDYEPPVTKGNLTAGSTKITIGGTGTGALIGAGATVDVAEGNLSLANLGTKAHSNLSGIGADDHHASGNVKDYTLGIKTGIKAGTNVTITDDGGYAKINASGGGGVPVLVMNGVNDSTVYFSGDNDYSNIFCMFIPKDIIAQFTQIRAMYCSRNYGSEGVQSLVQYYYDDSWGYLGYYVNCPVSTFSATAVDSGWSNIGTNSNNCVFEMHLSTDDSGDFYNLTVMFR